jgi:prepilin-type N-terminal cleavage/methylation domain-containing protein
MIVRRGSVPGLLLPERGYTLLELLVVLVLISILITLAVPTLKNTLSADPLKMTAMKIAGLVKAAREQAVRDQQEYLIEVNFSENLVEVRREVDQLPEAEEKDLRERNMVRMPDQVDLLDIWEKTMGRLSVGVAVIRVGRRGYMSETILHLSDQDAVIGMRFAPFLDKVDIVSGRIEPQ